MSIYTTEIRDIKLAIDQFFIAWEWNLIWDKILLLKVDICLKTIAWNSLKRFIGILYNSASRDNEEKCFNKLLRVFSEAKHFKDVL